MKACLGGLAEAEETHFYVVFPTYVSLVVIRKQTPEGKKNPCHKSFSEHVLCCQFIPSVDV